MKHLLIFAMALGPFAALANEMPVNAGNPTVTRTKITCNYDSRYVITSPDGSEIIQENKGETSETLRTSYSDGKSEYRIAEFKTYDAEGRLFQQGVSYAKTTETREGNRLTTVTVNNYTAFNTAGSESFFIDEKSRTSTIVEEIHGNRKIFIEGTENGKVIQDKYESLELQISSTEKVVYSTAQVPYDLNTEGSKVRVEKSEATCVYKTLN